MELLALLIDGIDGLPIATLVARPEEKCREC